MQSEEKQTKRKWYKTWWGVILILCLWPFFLSYWIWKRNWDTKVKYALIGGLWLFIFVNVGNISSYQAGYDRAKKEAEQINKPTLTVTTQPSPTTQPIIPSATKATQTLQTTPLPTTKPTQVLSKSPTTAPNQSYDKNKGNNYIAAKYAQNILDVVNNAAPGAFTDAMLELSPEDPAGKSEEAYKKSVSSAFLQIRTSSSFWSSLDDDHKKDLVASFVTSVGNIFPGAYPHIYVSNSARTVAEGEYNWTKTEPKITLK
jgi:hypothetical protein